MVKCPECGKELDQDDIVVPIFDATGRKLIDCFHVKRAIFDSFKEIAEKQGQDPGALLWKFVSDYVSRNR